jgi:hypothetical protein
VLVRLADWCYRRRRLVVVAWIAALVAAIALAGSFGGDYRQDYLQPGSESRAASDTLQQSFPQRSGATIQVVISSASGITAPDVQDRAEKLFADVARSEHVVRVTSPFSAEGAGQVAEDTRTAYAVVALNKTDDEFTPAEAKALVEPILGAGDATLRVEVGGAVAAKSKSVAIGSEGIGLMQRRSSCSSSSAPQSRWACPCSLPSSGSASRWRSASCCAAWSMCRTGRRTWWRWWGSASVSTTRCSSLPDSAAASLKDRTPGKRR